MHFRDCFTYVALDGNKIAGFISVNIKKFPDGTNKTIESYIDVIEVSQDFRRRGIAKKLLKLVEKESEKRRLQQIRAWSSDDKKEALAMWRSSGFQMKRQEIISAVTKKPVKGYFAAKVLGQRQS
ncbi:MAG: GNAT family N-acetyltransferase [Alphaproteobacteria bacterium]|nr:GNAT family N-acetyltransferase [Alphaproteobacteria bacterium]MCK5658700.1 GNAT family N-acetyltransferase [Alphaproteobacteria bacterium]